jgi:DNA/RNA-binding domain of Phe-tRNA-synthetase-like protein
MPKVLIEEKLLKDYANFGVEILEVTNIVFIDGIELVICNLISDVVASMNSTEYLNQAAAECQAWREIYRNMGLKASKTFCSFEALYKRTSKTNLIPRINPLVDCYNIISIKHCLCLGAYTSDSISGDINIRMALDGESITPIGSGEKLILDNKAIVYADQSGPICAYWNHRDADRTKVTKESKNVIFCIDDLNKKAERAQNAANELVSILQRICNSEIKFNRSSI